MLHKPELLLVSGDPPLVEQSRVHFESQGFAIRVHDALGDLLETVKARAPAVLIVDIDLSPEPPWDALAFLRMDAASGRLPLLIVSGRHTAPRHVISGLRLGAVEFLVKPCDPKVLVARVQALLGALQRRRQAAQQPLLTSSDGRLSLDVKAHRCALDQQDVRLTPKEFLILASLMGRPKQMVSKEELLRLLWPENAKADKDNILSLAQYIARLRRKLGKDCIRTIWGLGYSFEE